MYRDTQIERHHITPRSLGGSDTPENIAKLTPREHFIAHKLLAKIHGGRMWAALAYMSRGGTKSADGYKVKSRDYELAKAKDAEWRSKFYTENNPFKGKTHSGEALKKMSVPRYGNRGKNHPNYGRKVGKFEVEARIFIRDYKPEEKIDTSLRDRINAVICPENNCIKRMGRFYICLNASIAASKRDISGDRNPNYGNGQAISGNKNPMFGKSHSKETKLKIAEKAARRISCPHCERVGNIANMKRWHFDNCRSKGA